MYWKSSSQKTARYFSKILRHIVENNISFQMNLVSRLAAAVCAPGNHLYFNIAEHSDTVLSHNNYKIWLLSKTPCTKTTRYLRLIFRQPMLENITFKMNLVNRLAAADCASAVAGNIDISKRTCTIIYHQQDLDNIDILEVTFPKNGSLFFNNTSPYSRTQYFLSNEPSQPFGCSSLCTWQSSKLQHCETLWL